MAKRNHGAGGITPVALYEALHDHYGDLEWWPAEGPYEVMVGAVLTQRTSWRNVEIALANLRSAGILDIDSLLSTPVDTLEELIRPSGTYRQKASRLRGLFLMVDRKGNGSLEAFLDRPTEVLRQDLIDVPGIGPETADSIILYAAQRPAFVVDAYTRRVLDRLEVDAGTSYAQVASWFKDGLPVDADLYNNYHAVLVELAKDHCRARPRCKGCPLTAVCPTGEGAGPG
jgi:endonuclease-3 related protein